MSATNLFTSLNKKTATAYSLIRIFLGIILFIRGWLILADPDSILELGVSRSFFIYISLTGILHLVGGIFLILGVLTRIGALIQLPILFTAVFIVHKHAHLMMGGQSLELAVLVLFLLCIYLVFGSGTLSVRDYFAKKKT